MKRLFLLMWVATALHASPETDIDGLMREYSQSGVPGAAVLVQRNGGLPIYRAYGLAEVSSARRTVESTNYRLASLSKQFTAMAALLLVDRGQLDLEESLVDVFPDFSAYGKSIKIRHLMHHTSGLKSYENLIPAGQTKQVNDAWVLDRLKQQSRTDFVPGSQYSYSNTGYCILSQVVAKRAKRDFAEFVEKEIFLPLGMNASHVWDRDRPPAIAERAYGCTGSGAAFRLTDQSLTSATQGDGGVYTSVVDYRNWILGMESLLSARLQPRLFERGKLNDGSVVVYAAGWMIGSYRGQTRYAHNGSSIWFRTAVQHFPSKGLTILVLVNRAGATPWDTAERIADLFL